MVTFKLYLINISERSEGVASVRLLSCFVIPARCWNLVYAVCSHILSFFILFFLFRHYAAIELVQALLFQRVDVDGIFFLSVWCAEYDVCRFTLHV